MLCVVQCSSSVVFVSPAVQPSLTLDYLVRSFIDVHAATKGVNCLLTLISWIVSNESSSVSPGHAICCLFDTLLLVVYTICMLHVYITHEDLEECCPQFWLLFKDEGMHCLEHSPLMFPFGWQPSKFPLVLVSNLYLFQPWLIITIIDDLAELLIYNSVDMGRNPVQTVSNCREIDILKCNPWISFVEQQQMN